MWGHTCKSCCLHVQTDRMSAIDLDSFDLFFLNSDCATLEASMFRCPPQIITPEDDYGEREGERKKSLNPEYRCMLNQQHTAPLGMFFYVSLLRNWSWLRSCSRLPRENIQIQATALPSPPWRECAEARLNVLLQKMSRTSATSQ